MRERRNIYRVLVGKPEGKRPLGRSRHRWVNNIKMNLQEVGKGYRLDRADSGNGQVASNGECDNERLRSTNFGNFLTSWKPVSFSRIYLLIRVSECKAYLDTKMRIA
jgi:hypothetical protein